MIMTAVNAASPATDGPRLRLAGIWAYGDEVTDSLVLSYKQNNLRFFCINEEGIPIDSVAYRFMLKGHDTEWVTPFKEGWYFYTDLKPGDYEFVAQCRKTGGEWGPELHHHFSIATPWWLTWWAYCMYIVAGAGILIYILYLTRLKIRMHNQLIVERKNQRFKNDFVIQAGREFRTPLTIIRTTIEKLHDSSDRLTRTDIQHLRNSSRMLMQMVEQLIEFKEIDYNMPYKAKGDIIEMADIPINKGTTVVIAEPNDSLADVIRRDILKFMKAIAVKDADGFKQAIDTNLPDAIVMDTDFDNGNAYDLLHELKKNPSSASIPVILISDFDNSKSLLRAIRSEADDYMQKPFNCEVLTALVMKKIRSKNGIKSMPDERKAEVQQPFFEKRADKLFLERLDKTIEENMGNPEFDVNSLAETLNISRSQLYNKVKSLRGMSAVEYLRETRLKKAAEMLKNEYLSVKEVRCRVGMPDPTYFNRRFKERFDTCPTDYR